MHLKPHLLSERDKHDTTMKNTLFLFPATDCNIDWLHTRLIATHFATEPSKKRLASRLEQSADALYVMSGMLCLSCAHDGFAMTESRVRARADEATHESLRETKRKSIGMARLVLHIYRRDFYAKTMSIGSREQW